MPSAKELGAYNSMKEINSKTKQLNSSEIVLHCDNKKILNGSTAEIEKESQHVHEAGTIVHRIRKDMDVETIEISLECSNHKPKVN